MRAKDEIKKAGISSKLMAEAATVSAFFEKNKDQILLPEKYSQALKISVMQKLTQIWERNPDLTLNEVVSEVLAALPTIPSSDVLVGIVRYTVKKWENLKEKRAVAV